MRSRLIASGARCSQWVSSSCLLLGFHVIAQVAALHVLRERHSFCKLCHAALPYEAPWLVVRLTFGPRKPLRPPSGAMWLHEIKHDGFRVIARKDGAKVKLYSRPGK